MSPSPWQVRARTTVADCRVFAVERQDAVRADGQRAGDFYVLRSHDFVVVVALTPRDEVVLVRQYRHGAEALSLEIPGGLVDPGEDPLAAGLRELEEETGYRGGKASLLGWCHPNPAIMNNRCHFVLVRGVHADGAAAWDEHEELEVVVNDRRAVDRLCRENTITHSMTLAALHRLALAERG